jgi:hypothetical protein
MDDAISPNTKCAAFAKLPIELREVLPNLGGGKLKIWIAYLLRANQAGEAWPGLDTLSSDTGLSPSRASTLRNQLKQEGWLVPVASRGKRGMFSSPRFTVGIPAKDRTAKIAYGKDGARQKEKTPYGENAKHRTAEMQTEVDSIEVETNELESKKQFTNRKMVAKGEGDPRFGAVKTFYIEEFEKRRTGVKGKFDGRDGKALAQLLQDQPAASAESIIQWLSNAFDSNVTFPLLSGFRFHEFCNHVTKFTLGPLLKNGTVRTIGTFDEGNATQLEKLAQ